MRRLASFALFSVLVSTASVQAQDWSKAALEKSSRHREYVPIKHGDRTVQAFVVYPEVKQKAPVILLIHEIFGLSDWAKEMSDELAAQGYIVITPDLLTGAGPNGGGTDSLGGQDNVTKAIATLPADQVTADLDAAADYGRKLPAANGKLFVAGFCWGGSKSFAYATHRHDLAAAFVFYGTGPSDVSAITTPIYGFYAANDARVGATVPATTEAMKAAGKLYDPVTYEGAGHGFMRAGEAPDASPENKAARDQAFQRLTSLIDKANSGPAARAGAGKGHVPAPAVKPVAAEPACHDMKPSPSTPLEIAAIL